MSFLEVKVLDLQKKIMLKMFVKVLEAERNSGELCCPATAFYLGYIDETVEQR